ncbi:hypothetical protein IE4803_PB00385 (plasmid) [Rhizobium etli bv. phaseoli str. IE4803]|nr:hypothetical protein IE4803_PB00385 [Rhizobium etli bv. phaseoli str. IE4803]ARQ60823.1 hypothetical protein Kim5_PA00357 [Rhizobium sp. Kim5]
MLETTNVSISISFGAFWSRRTSPDSYRLPKYIIDRKYIDIAHTEIASRKDYPLAPNWH